MKNFLCLIGLLMMSPGYGQSNLKFEMINHDFGEIREEGGYAEHTFNFVNSGEEPITITQVKASCGCTTPGWTKEEVLPGDSGVVRARYNPRNRPGRFRKSLRITTTDAASNQTLYIMGIVKPKPKNPEEEYPVMVGDFRLKYEVLNMGKVSTEKPIEKSFAVYNSTDSALVLDSTAMLIPDHVSVTLSTGVLNPKEVGKLVITYDPILKNDYGFVNDNIVLDTASESSLTVMAIIEEYFPEMSTEELEKAPRLEISQSTYDFGTVDQGTLVEKTFSLNNVGKEHLALRAIKSNCDCIDYTIKSKRIKKGRSLELRVSFDTSEMRGNQYKSITVYSNDPVRPTQVININGKVNK